MGGFKKLDLKVGPSCNNNCLFCVQGHNKHMKDKSTAQVKKELEKNSKLCSQLVFTGGEPSVRPDFLEIIKHAKFLKYSLIQIQSNGRKFRDFDFCLDAVRAGANSFSFSIHGHNSGLHDFLTQSKGSFEETKQGIKNMVELGQPVSTNTVIINQNYRHLPEIAEFLSRLQPQQAQFSFVHAMGKAMKNFSLVVPNMSTIVPFLKKAVAVLEESKIEPRIEAIPPCLIPEYERYLAENDLPEIRIEGIDMIVDDWSIIRKKRAKMKFPQCSDCSFNLCCEGTWKEYPEHFGDEEFIPILPIMNELVIQLTKKCNLNCEFCFDNIETDRKEITKESIFQVIDSIMGKTKAIRFTGGEPLLRDDLKDILVYTKSKGIYTILNTNGLLFNHGNHSILDFVDDLLVSFHDFSQAESKSKLFKDLKKHMKGKNLRCCTILTKKNIENLEKFYSFMQFQPVDDWFLLRQIPNKADKEPITGAEAKEAVDKVFELNQKYRIKPKIANAVPFCITGMDKTASVCVGARNDSGHTRLYVLSNGDITPDYLSLKILGSLGEDINKIWLGDFMKSTRNMVYLPTACKDCMYKMGCKGGLSNQLYTDYLIPSDKRKSF